MPNGVRSRREQTLQTIGPVSLIPIYILPVHVKCAPMYVVYTKTHNTNDLLPITIKVCLLSFWVKGSGYWYILFDYRPRIGSVPQMSIHAFTFDCHMCSLLIHINH